MKLKIIGLKLSDYQLLFLVVALLLIIGILFFHYVQNLSWIDAYYFSVVTLATVGCGDITPRNDIEKIFTTFYIFVGVGVIGLFINTLVHKAQMRRKKLKKNRLKN